MSGKGEKVRAAKVSPGFHNQEKLVTLAGAVSLEFWGGSQLAMGQKVRSKKKSKGSAKYFQETRRWENRGEVAIRRWIRSSRGFLLEEVRVGGKGWYSCWNKEGELSPCPAPDSGWAVRQVRSPGSCRRQSGLKRVVEVWGEGWRSDPTRHIRKLSWEQQVGAQGFSVALNCRVASMFSSGPQQPVGRMKHRRWSNQARL